MRKPSREELWLHYLKTQTTGDLGKFNKKNFPSDYEEMINELKEWGENYEAK